MVEEEEKIPVTNFYKVFSSPGFQSVLPFHFQVNWKDMENIRIKDKNLHQWEAEKQEAQVIALHKVMTVNLQSGTTKVLGEVQS